MVDEYPILYKKIVYGNEDNYKLKVVHDLSAINA